MRERTSEARGLRLIPPEFIGALVESYSFPAPAAAEPDGLLAYGGDLGAERLLAAYAQGIFPWYESPPILWYSPDPRSLILPETLRIGRTLAKNLRRGLYTLRLDGDFSAVIEACARTPRSGQSGTWINDDMIEAYCELHALGFAHSAEVLREGELVGGLDGVSLGAAFFGESMFSTATDASKVALVGLLTHLRGWGFHFLDCQIANPTTERLGARVFPREQFLSRLALALQAPSRCGSWTLSSGMGSPIQGV